MPATSSAPSPPACTCTCRRSSTTVSVPRGPLPIPSTVAAVSTTITPAQATELLSRELTQRRLRAGAVRRRRGPLPQRGAGRPGPIARRLAAVARSHRAAPAQCLHRAAHRRPGRKLAARHSDRRAHCAARRRDRVGRRVARCRSARPVVREHGDPRRLVEPDLDARRSVAACASCSRRRAPDQRRGDAAVPQSRRPVARGRLRRGTESDRRRHVAVRVPQSQRLSAGGRRGARQARHHAAVARSHAQSHLCAGRRLRPVPRADCIAQEFHAARRARQHHSRAVEQRAGESRGRAHCRAAEYQSAARAHQPGARSVHGFRFARLALAARRDRRPGRPAARRAAVVA